VSGGTVNLVIQSSISYSSYQITGGTSLTAGGSETITITAVDGSGNPVTAVNGLVSLTFRGLGTSPAPYNIVPTVGGVNEGALVGLTFSSGVATATLVVAKAEGPVTLNVTDGTHDSGTSAGGAG